MISQQNSTRNEIEKEREREREGERERASERREIEQWNRRRTATGIKHRNESKRICLSTISVCVYLRCVYEEQSICVLRERERECQYTLWDVIVFLSENNSSDINNKMINRRCECRRNRDGVNEHGAEHTNENDKGNTSDLFYLVMSARSEMDCNIDDEMTKKKNTHTVSGEKREKKKTAKEPNAAQ